MYHVFQNLDFFHQNLNGVNDKQVNNICISVDEVCMFHKNIYFDIIKKLDVSNVFNNILFIIRWPYYIWIWYVFVWEKKLNFVDQS